MVSSSQGKDAADAPWSVEVPSISLPLITGEDGSLLKRLAKLTGCELELCRPQKKVKSVRYGGQTQYFEDAKEDGNAHAMNKIFIRGSSDKRRAAAEVIQAVAAGRDPEELEVAAQGGFVVAHDLAHPDREAWARWRLRLVAHEHHARLSLTRKSIEGSRKDGSKFDSAAAETLRKAVEGVVRDALELVELTVDAKESLEPEDAPKNGCISILAELHGCAVHVCDQDDNAVSDTMKLRVMAPANAAADAAEILRCCYVDGQMVKIVPWLMERTTTLAATGLSDFKGDLKQLEAEFKMRVHEGTVCYCLVGKELSSLTQGTRTLMEILKFYFPDYCEILPGVDETAQEHLLSDDGFGCLLRQTNSSFVILEASKEVWCCGEDMRAMKSLVQKLVSESTDPIMGHPPKRRRRCDLSVHSEAVAP